MKIYTPNFNKLLPQAKYIVVFLCCFVTQLITSQESSFWGNWKGTLKSLYGNIEINLEIKESPISGKLSSSSGINGLKLDDLVCSKNGDFSFKLPAMGINYLGKLNHNKILGKWKQGDKSVSVSFIRVSKEIKLFSNRIQTPKEPYNYIVKDVEIITKKDNIKLSGTLTIPKGEGPFPAAILLSVAGSNDRDQTHSLGHKPFLVLADYLTNNGIAVLRLDDRGVGGSEGNLMQSTFSDLTNDALAAYDFLKNKENIKKETIGFIGNSEGTVIATMAANQNASVAYTVQLGAVGEPLSKLQNDRLNRMQPMYKLTKEQKEEVLAYSSAVRNIVLKNRSTSQKKEMLAKVNAPLTFDNPKFKNELFFLPKSKEKRNELFLTPWYSAQINYNPEDYLKKLKTPSLFITGSLDMFQNAEINFPPIKYYLKESNNDVEYHIPKNVNHVMQVATTGFPDEYAKLESSFSQEVMVLIKNWILKRETSY